MRLRRAFALLGAVLLAFVCFMLYLMMDLTFPTRHTSAVQDIQEVNICFIEWGFGFNPVIVFSEQVATF